MVTTKSNIAWMARQLINNDHDSFVVLNQDGSCEAGPASCYSSIIECGQDPNNFGIAFMVRCCPGISLASAKEIIVEGLQDL